MLAIGQWVFILGMLGVLLPVLPGAPLIWAGIFFLVS